MSLKKVCKACLRSGETMFFLFDSIVPNFDSPSNFIVGMYEIFAELLIDSDTSFPNKICTDCFFEIQRTYYFMLKCERSEATLKKLKNVEIDFKSMETVPGLREHDNSSDTVDNISEVQNGNIERNKEDIDKRQFKLILYKDVNSEEDGNARLQHHALTDLCGDDHLEIRPLDHLDCVVNDNVNDEVSVMQDLKEGSELDTSTKSGEVDGIESDQYSADNDVCPICCPECTMMENLEKHIVDNHIKRQMCEICNPEIDLNNPTMTNSIKFGPGWFRNNFNNDTRRSSTSTSTPSLDTQRKNHQENHHLTQMNTVQNPELDGINKRIVAPSYSSVVRGLNSQSSGKEKPPEVGKGDTREFGILIERHYRERISGSTASSIKLIDSSVSSKFRLQEKYISREHGLITDNGDEKEDKDIHEIGEDGENEVELVEGCERIGSNLETEVNCNEFLEATSTKKQTVFVDSELEYALDDSNDENQNEVPIVNCESREMTYNGHNFVTSPKSTRWHNEISCKRRSEESVQSRTKVESPVNGTHKDYSDFHKVVHKDNSNFERCPRAFQFNDKSKGTIYAGLNSNLSKSTRLHDELSTGSEKELNNFAMPESLDHGARGDNSVTHEENNVARGDKNRVLKSNSCNNRYPPTFESNNASRELIYNRQTPIKSPTSVRWHNEINSRTRCKGPLYNCTMADSVDKDPRRDYNSFQKIAHNENSGNKGWASTFVNNNNDYTEWRPQNSIYNDVYKLDASNGIGDYMFKDDINRSFNKNVEYDAQATECPSYEWFSPSPRHTTPAVPAALDYNLITNPFLVPDPPIAQETPSSNRTCNYSDPHYSKSLYDSWLLNSSGHVTTSATLTRNDKPITNPFLDYDPPETVSLHAPASNQLWFYRDPQHIDQGPFMSTEMAEWFNCGYFDETLNVRRVCDSRFATLRELIEISGTRVPFLATHLIPPLQVNSVNSLGNPFIESMANQAY